VIELARGGIVVFETRKDVRIFHCRQLARNRVVVVVPQDRKRVMVSR